MSDRNTDDEVNVFVAFLIPKIRDMLARFQRMEWEGQISHEDRVGVALAIFRKAATRAEGVLAGHGKNVELDGAQAIALQAAIIEAVIGGSAMAIEIGDKLVPVEAVTPDPDPDETVH